MLLTKLTLLAVKWRTKNQQRLEGFHERLDDPSVPMEDKDTQRGSHRSILEKVTESVEEKTRCCRLEID